jgi:hypothetical protein
MKYLLKYKIFESQELLKYFKVGMEFHNSEGKLVGKVTNVRTMTSNFCTSCGEKIKKPESKFCTSCGKEIKFDNHSKKHIEYKNLVDGNEYEFNVKDFYDKLKQAGWNPNKEQINNNTEKKDETPSDPKADSKSNGSDSEFDKLCNDYSKMKGANLDQLELIKKMAQSEKDESMKLAMIRRLIDND